MLAIVLMIVMTHATVQGACADAFEDHSDAAAHTDSHDDHLPAEDGDCDEGNPGGDCCKCPCHATKIPFVRLSVSVQIGSLLFRIRPPHVDPERDAPAFDIFQPPKLVA
jgi:hypothetical protein